MKLPMALLAALLLFTACESPTGDSGTDDNTDKAGGSLSIELAFPTTERARGVYIWVTDADGNYIDTIQQYGGRTDVSGETYYELGYRYENDLCDDWKTAAGEAGTTTSASELVIDGVTTASILAYHSGTYTSETWNLKDSSGVNISEGSYLIEVEVTYDATDHPALTTSRASGSINLEDSDAGTNLTLSGDTVKLTSASVSFTSN